MKRPMAILLAVALVVTALTGAVAYAAEAGTAEDPLVTLSYMTTTFKQELTSLFQGMLDDSASSLEDTMDSQLAALEQSLASADAAAPAEDTAWQTITLTGQSLDVDAGAQLLLISGTAAFSGGYVVDSTDGTASAGMTMHEDHLYVVSAAGTVSGEGTLLLKP